MMLSDNEKMTFSFCVDGFMRKKRESIGFLVGWIMVKRGIGIRSESYYSVVLYV